MEGNRFVDQHDRNQVLETDVRHVAIVHGICCAGGGTDDYFLYLIRLERVALLQNFQRVEGRLNWSARGPLLERRYHYTVELAKLIDHARGIRLGVVGLHEIVRAGQDIVNASPSRVDYEGSVDPVASPHRAKQEGLLDMLGVTPPRADAGAGLLCCIVKQPAHLLGTQTGHAT